MLQIIFTLLVFQSAMAIQMYCPVEDLPSQCYAELCKDAKSNIVPISQSAFEAEMKNFRYQIPANIQKDLNSYTEVVKLFMAKKKKFLLSVTGEKAAQVLTTNFMDHEETIDKLVAANITFTNENGNLTSIISDLEPSRNEFYKTLAENLIQIKQMVADFKSRAKPGSTESVFKNLYPILIEYYKNHPGPNKEKLEASMAILSGGISDPATHQKIVDGLDYDDFFSMMNERFENVKPLLARAFDDFKSETEKIDHSKTILKNFGNSCKVAQYFLDKTKNRNLQGEYEKMQELSIEKMEKIFMPMLSSHTRSFVTSKIDKSIFVSLAKNPDIYPDLKASKDDLESLGDIELETYIDFENSMQTSMDAIACDSSIYKPNGEFGDGKILIPFSTIALGHGDTVTHEVGHWISSLMGKEGISPESKKQYLELRACLKSFYKNPGTTSKALYKDDGFKTEEDFADWFDFTLNGDMKSHFTCDATIIIPMLTSYISGERSSSLSDLYAPDARDTHSNDVFRELHELLVKGRKIPKACAELMKQNPDSPKACKL